MTTVYNLTNCLEITGLEANLPKAKIPTKQRRLSASSRASTSSSMSHLLANPSGNNPHIRHAQTNAPHLKREGMLAVILGTDHFSREDLFHEPAPLSSSTASNSCDFEAKLVATYSLPAKITISLLCFGVHDARRDNSRLLYALLSSSTFLVFEILPATEFGTETMELKLSLHQVSSFAQISVPIITPASSLLSEGAKEAPSVYTLTIPLVLYTSAFKRCNCLLGYREMGEVNLNLVQLADLSVIRLAFHSSQGAMPNLILSSPGQVSEFVSYSTATNAPTIMRILPIFTLNHRLFAEIAAIFWEFYGGNGAQTTAFCFIRRLHHRSQNCSFETVLLETLLDLFHVDHGLKKCIFTMLQLPSTDLPSSATSFDQVFESISDLYQNVFLLFHSLLQDKLLAGTEFFHVQILAQTLLALIVLLFQLSNLDSSQLQTIAVYFDYYNSILGFSCGSLVSLGCPPLKGTPSIAFPPHFLRHQRVPCAARWLCAALKFHCSPHENSSSSSDFECVLSLASSNESNFNHIRCTALFLSCFQFQPSSPFLKTPSVLDFTLLVTRSFNKFLLQISVLQRFSLVRSELILYALYLPPLIRSLIEASLTLSASHYCENWLPSILQHMKRRDVLYNIGIERFSKNLLQGESVLDEEVNEMNDVKNSRESEEDLDGFTEVEKIALLRFPDDQRVKEVCRILRSSKSLYLRVMRSAEDDSDPVAYR